MAIKTSKSASHDASFDGLNDGYPIPVVVVKNPDGSSTYNSDLSSLASPAEVFAADGVDIQFIESTYRIAFYKKRLYGHGARALVEVIISEKAADPFIKTLTSLSKKDGESIALEGLLEEPEKSVAVVANILKIAQNDLGATIDFYFVSPTAMEASAKIRVLYYKDVVRISTTGMVFFAFVKYFLSKVKDE